MKDWYDTKLSDSLVDSLAQLEEMNSAHLEVGLQLMRADRGALYGVDLLAFGALNRSMAHIAGFRMLIEAKNMICAGAVLRLQLDTAMRFYAAFLVERPHDFALAIVQGKHVRDLQDRDGNRMTDSYLADKLGEKFEWVPRVYARTSGYVHLSATHIMSTLSPETGSSPSGGVEFKVSAEDGPLPDWIYIEASDAFGAATDIFLYYLRSWVFTKANPDLVNRVKRKQDDTKEDTQPRHETP